MPASYSTWSDPILQVKGEKKWVKQYRLLQSWYRQKVLSAPPGKATSGRRRDLVGSMLDEDWSREHPGKNFLDPEVAAYVEKRLLQIRAEGGTADPDRLRRNLLSSQPLCFNLFGFLRQRKDAAAAALQEALEITIADVTLIEVEWAPCPHPLCDRTAFDAYVEYRTGEGEPGFLGIETKYTERFSPKRYEKTRYTEITEAPGSGFRPGAAEQLADPLTNQLWRNAMLALEHQKSGFGEALSVVLHADGDEDIGEAIDTFRDQREPPETLLRVVTYERLIAAIEAEAEPDVADWCRRFRKRYLDLSPVS